MSGYTLIELLVVVALMALVAAFTIPTYQLILAEEELSSATGQVVDFMQLTQQRTITEQKIYGDSFIVGGTSTQQFLYDSQSSTKTTQTTFSLAPNTQISAVNLSSNTDIRFSTAAAPSVSGTIEIMDTQRGRHKLITIAPSGSITANQPEY